MKFTPKFTGRWYRLDVAEGVEIELPPNLAEKAKARPDLFAVKRKKANAKNTK